MLLSHYEQLLLIVTLWVYENKYELIKFLKISKHYGTVNTITVCSINNNIICS